MAHRGALVRVPHPEQRTPRDPGRRPGSPGSARPHAWDETAADLAAGRPVRDLDDVDVHPSMFPRAGNRVVILMR
jgi:hypothetical protein